MKGVPSLFLRYCLNTVNAGLREERCGPRELAATQRDCRLAHVVSTATHCDTAANLLPPLNAPTTPFLFLFSYFESSLFRHEF